MRHHRALIGLILISCTACAPNMTGKPKHVLRRPRLIVQITVDQLRGDLPARNLDRLGEGGFKRLMRTGAWFASAIHPHARTETVVGHTTLATGAYPAAHGMVSNRWYQKEDNDEYVKRDSISDPDYRVFGEDGKTGVSPRAILASTFSDELYHRTGGAAKIFSVSGKDRAAIPLAGHTGKAFFYATLTNQGSTTGNFTTSSYYYDDDAFPPSDENPTLTFMEEWNKQEVDCGDGDRRRRVLCMLGKKWHLSRPIESYLFKEVTNSFPAGTPPAGQMAFLETSPYSLFLDSFIDDQGNLRGHTYGSSPTTPTYFNNLTISPELDRLTIEFAKMLVATQHLGEDDVPDYLAIGLSATDLIAHWWGPNSLESEDNMLQLDATLASFFSWLDTRVGQENTLIVLSGDHGGPEFPEVLAAAKLGPGLAQTYTGRVASNTIPRAVQGALEQLAGEPIACIVSEDGEGYSAFESGCLIYSFPYLYMSDELVAQAGTHRSAVEMAAANAVSTVEGVLVGVRARDANGGRGIYEELAAMVRRNDHPWRSGQVYVVQAPQWQVNNSPSPGEGSGDMILLEHGSPWAYDTHVPIVFAGAGVPHRFVTRRVHTTDVAATLAAMLDTNEPSALVGTPLVEVWP